MRVIEEMEPVKYIVFDNGGRRKASDVLKELDDMTCADFTDFDLDNAADRGLLELIREKCGEAIDYEATLSGGDIRVCWKASNEILVGALMEEVSREVYGEEVERD